MAKYYAIYLAKDDTLIACGTAKECMKLMRLKSMSCFYSIVSKVRKGTFKKYEILEEPDDVLE